MTPNVHIDTEFSAKRREVFEASEGNETLRSKGYTVAIEVTGRGEFPYDQLRRYRLIPIGTTSGMNSSPEVRTVSFEFADDSVIEGFVDECAARFASFGWVVSNCKIWVA